MNHTMDRLFILLEALGGILLFAAACASDGGLPLREILERAVLAALLLGAGALGHALCTRRDVSGAERVRQRRPDAWKKAKTAHKASPAAYD